MNFINHNGFKLPVLGANVSDSNPQEKAEYLMLLMKASGKYFSGGENFYGIPKFNENLATYYYWNAQSDANLYLDEIIPISTAITWLKLAVGEITADNFAVDVRIPDERLEDFKDWYDKETNDYWSFDQDYYGFKYKKALHTDVRLFDNSVPVITPTQFFAYLYTDVVSKPMKEDDEDRWIELTGTPMEAPDVDMWVLSKEGEVRFSPQGEYVQIGFYTHYMIAKKPLPPPIESPAELKRKEAEEWLEKSTSFSKMTPGLVDVLTAYKLDQEN